MGDVQDLVRTQAKAGEAHLSGAQRETLERFLREAQQRPADPQRLSALDHSYCEATLEEWLDKRGAL
ncbi:MAG: hypothetical protein EXR47_00660 [Dehalococcoidia bacterium]|nr:hypothetical protein [Dehalococcoidia bacterium]